jgi:hypothetical protein
MFTAYNTPTYIEQAQTMNGNLTALVLTGDSTSSGPLNWALEKVGRFVHVAIQNSGAIPIIDTGVTVITSQTGIIPVEYRPLATRTSLCLIENNSFGAAGYCIISTNGTFTFQPTILETNNGFTNIAAILDTTFIYII